MILPWYGEIEDIPQGWKLCDGTDGTPDLRDRFIFGAGKSYSLNDLGGEATHTLTVDEMPIHNHKQYIEIWNEDGGQAGNGITSNGSKILEQILYWQSEYSGGSQPHNNLPPYIALYWIMYMK